MKNLVIKYLIFFYCSFALCQISNYSTPKSYSYELSQSVYRVETDHINIDELLYQEKIDNDMDLPFKFGHSFSVDIDFFEIATVDFLSNGDKVYRLEINSKDAFSINLIFDQFYISEETELFIYNKSKQHTIGAFTHKNNKHYKRFSTAPVKGDMIIIEFYEPSHVKSESIINLSNIVHGYKDVFRGYEDSEECHNNVNCAEFQSWNDEVSSVLLTLTDGGTRLCSGSLINNVNQDLELYFLTSETCLGGHEDWIFMFNYESSSCSNQDGITNQTVSGATLLVNHYESDFALLKLEENPPEDYDIYFSGWDITGDNPFNCTSIHHPVGDIKKISQHTGVAISDGWFFDDDTHWKINEWSSGITEPGSYGAPLFNEDKQIVGQLHGGESSCDNPVDDYFGKLSHSWNLGLKEYLDPDNTGITEIDGVGVINSPDPEIAYSNEEFNFLISNDESPNAFLFITNVGEEESILNYKIYNSPFSKTFTLPDQGNYYWIDSDNSNIDNYYWLNIENIGNQVWFQDNDAASGPFNIGFEFPFYNNTYNNFIVSPNGWIGFIDDNPAYENISIPSVDAPKPAILAFWDDLNPINLESSPDMSGRVKYYSDGSKLVVSYNDIAQWGESSRLNFQIIIYKNGHIDINYAGMTGDRTSSTIGIQNDDGTIAQEVIYNNNYLHNFLGISFEKAPPWFTIDEENYLENELSDFESTNHNFNINSSQVDNGNYLTYVHIESNATGPITIPIQVQVGYQSDLGDVNYDQTINVQDVVLLISIILNTYPPNLEADINLDGLINVLDTVLLIEIILD